MIYLAIPYTGIEETSFKVATAITGELMKRGEHVYSPITHSHEVARVTKLPTEWAYWEKVDREFISRCDELFVVCIDGWEESTGVQAEIEIAAEFGLPVRFLLATGFSSSITFNAVCGRIYDLRIFAD